MITSTATPTAMQTAVHIHLYIISDHVKLNIRRQQGDGGGGYLPTSLLPIALITSTATPTAMPTAVHFHLYIFSDHVKLNIRRQQGDGGGGYLPTS